MDGPYRIIRTTLKLSRDLTDEQMHEEIAKSMVGSGHDLESISFQSAKPSLDSRHYRVQEIINERQN